jgi:hypothetical protein
LSSIPLQALPCFPHKKGCFTPYRSAHPGLECRPLPSSGRSRFPGPPGSGRLRRRTGRRFPIGSSSGIAPRNATTSQRR